MMPMVRTIRPSSLLSSEHVLDAIANLALLPIRLLLGARKWVIARGSGVDPSFCSLGL
jgi:hypothetical protein